MDILKSLSIIKTGVRRSHLRQGYGGQVAQGAKVYAKFEKRIKLNERGGKPATRSQVYQTENNQKR